MAIGVLFLEKNVCVPLLVAGSICLAMAVASESNQVACYNAKTCVHNSKQKCGVDKDGTLRRFFDTCDMMEYNCLRFKDFIRTSMERCKKLPPPDPKSRKYE